MPTTPQPAPSVQCANGHITKIATANIAVEGKIGTLRMKPTTCPACGSPELRLLESRRIRD